MASRRLLRVALTLAFGGIACSTLRLGQEPSPPPRVSVTSGADFITVRWSAVEGAIGYVLFVGSSEEQRIETTATGISLPATPGSTYGVAVSTRVSSGESVRTRTLFGMASGLKYAPVPDAVVEGIQAAGRLGSSLASGDVNGDGRMDLAIGAPKENSGASGAGKVYLAFGTTGGMQLAPWTAEPTQGEADSACGSSVEIADVDGDGYGDVFMGAPETGGTANRFGAVFAYRGRTGIPASTVWFSQTGIADQRVGAWLDAGDYDRDGFDDLMVGAAVLVGDAEGARFFPGSAAGLTTSRISFPLRGPGTVGNAGADVGDVNGDGWDDLLLGEPHHAPGAGPTGRGYLALRYGGPLGPIDPVEWYHEGLDPEGHEGSAIAAAGDVNRDGFADFFSSDVPASDQGGPQRPARVDLWLGGPTAPAALRRFDSLSQDPVDYEDLPQATAADLDGDGWPEVVIGESGFDESSFNGGRVRVYRSGPLGLSSAASWTYLPAQGNSYFGYSLATGDVDGDGLADLMVGEPAWDGGLSDVGRVNVFRGRAAAGPTADAGYPIQAPLGTYVRLVDPLVSDVVRGSVLRCEIDWADPTSPSLEVVEPCSTQLLLEHAGHDYDDPSNIGRLEIVLRVIAPDGRKAEAMTVVEVRQ